jgi:DNA repair protein RadC
MQTIKPRERLIKFGVQSLLDEELMALLLHSGSQKKDVFTLSKEVMQLLTSIKDLKTLRLVELTSIKGIKIAKATTILAAIELGIRLIHDKKDHNIKIENIESVFHVAFDLIGHFNQEHFLALFLNTKGILIHKEIIFKGTLNQTLIHPREIFHIAVKVLASSIIVVHNHPSGDVNPSKADIEITENFMENGRLIGIEVLDHMIIGVNSIYSIRHKKELKIML